MYSVCTYGNGPNAIMVRCDVDACPEKREITVIVSTYGLGKDNVRKTFPADQYGEALDLYDSLCLLAKERYEASQKA